MVLRVGSQEKITRTSAFDVIRLIKALGYSLEGLKAAWQHQAAFRLEVLLLVVLAPIGVALGQTGVERALLVGTLLLVLLVELLNSAIETIVDRIGPERHPLSKRAKDIGSTAVLISLVIAGVTWLMILIG